MNHFKRIALKLVVMTMVLGTLGLLNTVQAKAAIEPSHEIKYNLRTDLFNESAILSLFAATKKMR